MVSDRLLRRLIPSDRVVALTGDLIRAVVAIFVVVAIAAVVTYHAAMVRFMYTTLHMNDFGKFYYSARAFLDGGDMYGPTPATAIPVGDQETRQFWNMNPPHFHLILLPLAGISPAYALGLWGGANLLALALSIWIVSAETSLRWTPSGFVWAGLAIVTNAATGATVVTGQLSFLLMLGVTLAWQAARHDRWMRAALWLGLIASVKPFLAVFWIYLIVRQLWRPAAAMATVAIAAFGVGVPLFGWANYESWMAAVRAASWTWPPMNGSIAGLLSRSLAPSPLFTPLFELPSAVVLITAVLTAAVVIATVAALKRSATGIDRAFLILLLSTLLITPLGWIYYLWLPLGPAVACWNPRTEWTRAQRVVAVGSLAGLACPLVLTGIWPVSAWASPTIGSAYFWTVFGAWLLALAPRGPLSFQRDVVPAGH